MAKETKKERKKRENREARVPALATRGGEGGGALVAGDGFEAYAGQGMETVTANDLLIPRLLIAQKLSPQLKKREPQYIKGAKEGDICDTALGLHFDHVDFLPVVYRKKWIEWAPRSSKRGIVAAYDDDKILAKCAVQEKGPPKHGDNVVIETAQFYGFRCAEDGDMTQAFIAMTSTQLKKARRWLSFSTNIKLARADGTKFVPPLWYSVYRLDGTSEENNDEGDWRGWVIERGIPITEWCEEHGRNWEEVRNEILAFSKAVSSGTVKNFTTDDSTAGDDNAPF